MSVWYCNYTADKYKFLLINLHSCTIKLTRKCGNYSYGCSIVICSLTLCSLQLARACKNSFVLARSLSSTCCLPLKLARTRSHFSHSLTLARTHTHLPTHWLSLSGVLLNMEVGIHKRAWHTCIWYTLLIYDHWGEYTLSKKLGGWCTAYTRVYPPIHHCSHSLSLKLSRTRSPSAAKPFNFHSASFMLFLEWIHLLCSDQIL